MAFPKVSIVVPVYNASSYIERCCISLFRQSYSNIEILFCDDCSNDNSIEIIKCVVKKFPLREEQINILCNFSNLGVAATRNILVANAKGDYITFVDSDDWLEETAVEKMVKMAELDNCDIVTGYSRRIHPSSDEIVKEQAFDSPQDMLLPLLCNKSYHQDWARLYRLSLFKDNNIKAVDGKNMGEDWFLLIQAVFFAKRISYLDEVVYNYDMTNDKSEMHKLQNTVGRLEWHKAEMDNLQEILFFLVRNKYKEIDKYEIFMLSKINDGLVQSALSKNKVCFLYFKKILKWIPKELLLKENGLACNWLYTFGPYYFVFRLYFMLGRMKEFLIK